MKERKLILEPQFEGIYVREEGDENMELISLMIEGLELSQIKLSVMRIFKRFKTWRIQAT